MKKRIHIFVPEHTIEDVSHSGYTPGDYYELDTFIEVFIDEDDAIENEVDELLRYDYDLGYIYDNNLIEWSVVE